MKTESNLERVLESGNFAVTAEISPPQNGEPELVREKARLMKGYIDAFNAPDGQAAVVMMASWAVCLIGMSEGLEPVFQMTCRDRNRIALQMDILGISAFGIKNILCLSGDPVSYGDHPKAKEVNDLTCQELVKVVKVLRDEKKFENGLLISGREPRLFIGAVANPFLNPQEPELERLKSKIAAGADFIQTQPIFNIEKFDRWMGLVRREGLHKKARILAGITPLISVAAARYMQTKVPGMDVPEKTIERLRKARTKDEVIEIGINIAAETINALRQIEGTAGVHLMTIGREEMVPRICKAAGLYPRP